MLTIHELAKELELVITSIKVNQEYPAYVTVRSDGHLVIENHLNVPTSDNPTLFWVETVQDFDGCNFHSFAGDLYASYRAGLDGHMDYYTLAS